jgi:uncharacterized membrane protein YccC
VILVGVLTLAIRSLGPANFGVSATAVTALVVLLVSFAGTSPESTIHYRGVDTILGGLLSLAAYAIWPTWERSHVGDYLAVMLDAYRRYFDAVMEAYIGVRRPPPAEMTAFRLEARLERSNAEASIDRLRSEPAGSAQEGAAMSGVLASSHRFAQAAMRIEASLYTRTDGLVPATLDGFVRDVDTALEHLSADLRHRALAGRSGVHNDASTCGQWVDLRQDQNALIDEARLRARDGAPLLMETERIANSLNTIRDVLRQAAGTTSSPQPNESGARSGESVA